MDRVPKRAFGPDVPRPILEVVDPRRPALLVDDVQVGIVTQALGLRAFLPRVVEVVDAARAAVPRPSFRRHMSLPLALVGVSLWRTAMSWRPNQARRGRKLPLPAGFARVRIDP